MRLLTPGARPLDFDIAIQCESFLLVELHAVAACSVFYVLPGISVTAAVSNNARRHSSLLSRPHSRRCSPLVPCSGIRQIVGLAEWACCVALQLVAPKC